MTPPAPVLAFCERRYRLLAAAVLALAAFNLTWRLGHEVVTHWDESLYAVTAWEMHESGRWIATTFLGEIDYYNTKPPLNVWLIVLAFEAFGRGLVSLRLHSAVSAWLTVAGLMWWVRRAWGPAPSLAAGLVLSTTYGFIYLHSGRSGNPDALNTLLVTLTAVVLWLSGRRPWIRVWLGPILAAVFLLRGAAVFQPLLLVAVMEALRGRRPGWARPAAYAAAAAIFLVPVLAWGLARWRLDEWRFFERMWSYDFIGRSVTALEEHPSGPFHYLNILQRHQYDWLLAGAAAWLLFPVAWRRVRAGLAFWRGGDRAILVACWAGATLLVPAIMRTKIDWYLNPFYPVFALGIGALLVHGAASSAERPGGRRRLVALAAVAVVALGVAEGKLIWYSLARRDLGRSVQGLLMSEGDRLAGRQVFRDRWEAPEIFVAGGLLGARWRLASTVDEFGRDARAGDYLLSAAPLDRADLALAQSGAGHWLYRRRE